jgi:dTDP-4-amino-4,6-dideoxygalactose transaminase
VHHQKAQAMKWFGIDRNTSKDLNGNWKGQQWDVDIFAEGYKFNMNNIAAAIGLSQLNHIDDIIIKHRFNAELYDSLFNDHNDFVKLTKRSSKDLSSFWVYTMFLNTTKQKKRIKAGVVHIPNHRYSCFDHIYRDLPGVDKFYNRQFSLPCGWWLDSYDIKEIANTTLKVAKEILK